MQRIRPSLLGASLVLVTAGAALAQIPDEFTNLKVLPEDIGKQELVGTMRAFGDALGVRCTYCHEEKVPGDRSTIDWASDALEHKTVARGMMKMAGQINGDLLPAATGEEGHRIGCVTCHRGLTDPATLDEVMLETVAEDGVDAAVGRYRELREKYYGSGSYDFGVEPLGKAAETLAREKGDMAAAATMIDLNVEMHPENSEVYVMQAQARLAGGDRDGARDSVEQALALDPENEHAARLLEQLDRQ